MRRWARGPDPVHVRRPGTRGYRRRVSSFWEADGQGGHRLVFRWNARADTFERVGDVYQPEQLGGYVEFLRGLLDQGEVEANAVRHRVVDLYRCGM